MLTVQVQGATAVSRTMARLRQDLGEARARGLKQGSVVVRGQLTELMSRPGLSDAFWGKHGAPGAGLTTRSGQTKARLSPAGQLYHSGDTAYSTVGSPDRHVAALEEGGSFTSGGKMFRIPTAAAQTGAGVDRWAGVSIRDIPGVHLQRSRSGHLWAVQDQGKASGLKGRAGQGARRLTFLYLLVRSIRLGAHATFQTAKRYAEPKVAALMRGNVSLAVQRAK